MASENEQIANQFLTPGLAPIPKASENESIADEFLGLSQSEITQSVIQQTLRNDFDPENFAPSKLRISLARGDNLEEKRLRLKKVHPEGDVKVFERSLFFPDAPKGKTLLFRESPNSQWKQVEPPGIDLTDVAELIAPSAEAIAGETLAAVLTGGGSIPQTVARQAVGALAGEAVEQAGQSIRGTQAQSLGEIAFEPLKEGAASGIGGFAVSPLVALKNVATGRGALQVGEEGLETVGAAKSLGIDDLLTPGLVSDNPLVQISENQARSILPSVQRRYRDIAVAIDTALRAGAPEQTARKAMRQTVSNLENYGNQQVRKLSVGSTTSSKGGRALQEGIAEYDTVANRVVNDLYDVARKVEEPNFNFSPLTNTAHDLRAGSKGTIDPGIERLLRQAEAIEGPIQLSDGSILTVGEQLRNVRTGAYAKRFVKEGDVADQTTGQASDLYRALNDVLDNPTNANPTFVNAWRSASAAARDRFSTLEKLAVVKVARSQNPAELVDQFGKPRQVENLRVIRDTVDTSKWNQFTDSFRTDLLRKPEALTSKLDSFDQETLDVLIPRAEQSAWRKVATEFDRIAATGAGDLAERQVTNKRFMAKFIESASPRDSVTLIRAARAGDPGMLDSVRASIIDWAWDGVARKTKTSVKIERDILAGRIQRLKDAGLWNALTGDQKLLIRDADTVARAFKTLDDAGTSLRAASIGAGILKLRPGAIVGFLQSGIVSHFYLSPAGRQVLIGTGKPSSRGRFMRVLGGALTQISSVEDISQLEQE